MANIWVQRSWPAPVGGRHPRQWPGRLCRLQRLGGTQHVQLNTLSLHPGGGWTNTVSCWGSWGLGGWPGGAGQSPRWGGRNWGAAGRGGPTQEHWAQLVRGGVNSSWGQDCQGEALQWAGGWGGQGRGRGEDRGCHSPVHGGRTGWAAGKLQGARGRGYCREWVCGGMDAEFRFRASEVRERPTVSHFQSLSTISLALSHTQAHTHLHTCTRPCTHRQAQTHPSPNRG